MKLIKWLLTAIAFFVFSSKVNAVCQTGMIRVTSSNCDPNVYDCSKIIGSTGTDDPNFCARNYPNSCYEVTEDETGIFKTTVCFLQKGIATPTNCTRGRLNCACNSSQPYCTVGSTPQGGGNSCRCVNATSTGTASITPASNWGGVNPFCDGSNSEIQTAFGCVPVTPEGFIQWLLPKLFGFLGGISFLLLIYGFLRIALSSGDEKAVQGARETISSAIFGLLFSLFALFILRLILVNILHIPGIN